MGYCSILKNNFEREKSLLPRVFFNIISVISLFCQFQSLYFVSVMLFGIWAIFTCSTLYLSGELYNIVLLIYGSPLMFLLVYRFILFSVSYISSSFSYFIKVGTSINPEDNCSKQFKDILNKETENKWHMIIHNIGIIIAVVGVVVGLVVYLVVEMVYIFNGKKNGHRTPSFLGTMGISYLITGGLIQLIILDCIQQCKAIQKASFNDKEYTFFFCFLKFIPCYSILGCIYSIICDYCTKTNSGNNTKSSTCQWIFVIIITLISIILLVAFFAFYIWAIIDTWKDSNKLLLYVILFLLSILSNGVSVIKELRNRKEEKTNFKKVSDEPDSWFGFDYNSSIILLIVLIVIVIITIFVIVGMVFILPKIKTKFKGDNTKKGIKNYEPSFDLAQELNGFIDGISYDYFFDEYYYQQPSKITSNTRGHSHLCSNDPYGITPAEYGYFSYLAYNKPVIKLQKHYQGNFLKKDDELVFYKENDENERNKYELLSQYLKDKGWSFQYHNKNGLYYIIGTKVCKEDKTDKEQNKVKVIAFKGTNSLSDGLYDIQLFAESAFPTISVTVFPVFTKQTLSRISYGLSFFGTKAFEKDEPTLLGTAKKIVKEEMKDGIPLVVTGHSLGGGIANIVGTEYGLSSFGISPPGTFLGSKGLGLKKKDVTVLARAVIPDRDPVAALGIDGGLQIRIPCNANSLKCHGIHNSVCMIGELCIDKSMIKLCNKTWLSWGFDISKT
ncbi:hypothetical protein ENUP19_0014G0026 [Entamoeba nuttalli]